MTRSSAKRFEPNCCSHDRPPRRAGFLSQSPHFYADPTAAMDGADHLPARRYRSRGPAAVYLVQLCHISAPTFDPKCKRTASAMTSMACCSRQTVRPRSRFPAPPSQQRSFQAIPTFAARTLAAARSPSTPDSDDQFSGRTRQLSRRRGESGRGFFVVASLPA